MPSQQLPSMLLRESHPECSNFLERVLFSHWGSLQEDRPTISTMRPLHKSLLNTLLVQQPESCQGATHSRLDAKDSLATARKTEGAPDAGPALE